AQPVAAGSVPVAPSAPPGPPAPVRAPLTDVVPRRTLVIIAVVAALAVLGTVLAVAFSGGGDDKDKGTSGSKASSGATAGSASGGKTGGAQGTGQGNGQQQGQGQGQTQTQGQTQGQGQGQSGGKSPAASTSPGSGGNGGAAAGLPSGYTMVTDGDFHFSMAMPAGFHRVGIAGDNSGGIYAAGGGFPRVQVDFNAKPTDDARRAWLELAGAVAGSSSNYHLLGIQKVDYKGYPTVADWQFERDQSGERVRILNRGFKVDGSHGYAIMVTCKTAEWDGDACVTLRKTAFDTFSPKD
ncbi:serine/threonine protein kinase, partial [Streptomyces sp. NPDC005877]